MLCCNFLHIQSKPGWKDGYNFSTFILHETFHKICCLRQLPPGQQHAIESLTRPRSGLFPGPAVYSVISFPLPHPTKIPPHSAWLIRNQALWVWIYNITAPPTVIVWQTCVSLNVCNGKQREGTSEARDAIWGYLDGPGCWRNLINRPF